MKGIEENSPKDPAEEKLNDIKELLTTRGISFGIFATEMRDTVRHEPDRRQIEAVGYGAIAQILEEMPIENVDIGVFDKPESVINQLGIGGFAHGGYPRSRIEIDLDPESPHKEIAMGVELVRTIRHEMHHDIRLKYLGQDKTLLERLVTEGLAQWYEIEGTEEEPPIYATALNSEQLGYFLERVRAEFGSVDPEVWRDWFLDQRKRIFLIGQGMQLAFIWLESI